MGDILCRICGEHGDIFCDGCMEPVCYECCEETDNGEYFCTACRVGVVVAE